MNLYLVRSHLAALAAVLSIGCLLSQMSAWDTRVQADIARVLPSIPLQKLPHDFAHTNPPATPLGHCGLAPAKPA